MLFQKNILKKYADAAPQETVAQAWQQFKQYFLNPDIQENIRQSKEEQFQEGFLRELFVKVLGYTLNPSPDYNLITEQKNETNSKKADGAILVDGKVVGVIELKDHKTTDLSKIEQQAFGYKNQNQNATYVVISNFEKLRFYIDNAVECVEFDLFHLTENEFGTLWLCLAWPNIAANLPKRIKAESVSSEDAITNALYRDYTTFKQVLYQDILKNNCGDAGRDAANCTDAMNRVPTAVELYKKTQKLLDRLLFIFFAEDGGLLPPNTMVKIIADWEKLAELDEYQPLYNRIKKYFGYLDTGYRGKDYEIFAYNGGLFKPDDVLDSLVISDDVLAAHTRRLSEYDYRSEVDVNILGHIFENSLNEIENVENQSVTESAPTTTTKRKRDGVFYTPQYITKYIVENTVGRLCTDKKAELQINEQEYFADKQRKSSTKKALLEKLDAYRKWLLQITICDPACGSGAFLNAALNFLIAEHRLVDEMEAKVLEQPMVIPNIENSILENNLFGVDINEESVEIAKLSLWLRTAQKHRKLNSLNRNIKCGNSLIADPAVAGSKAFDWQAEFPQVFERGGFDVVIGNPPYGAEFSKNEIDYFLKTYKFQSYQLDSYLIFTEKTDFFVKKDGYVGFIMPNTWLSTIFSNNIRKFVFETFAMKELRHYSYFVFADATVETDVYVWKKEENIIDNEINVSFIERENDSMPQNKTILQKSIIEKNGAPINIYEREEFSGIKSKCEGLSKLGDLFQIVQGTKPFQKGKGNPPQTEDILESQIFVQEYKKDDTYLPCLRGSLINRYSTFWNNNYYISYGDWLAEPRYSAKFDTKEKLVIRQTGDSIIVTYDDKQFICRDNLYVLRDDDNKYSLKSLLAVLNSNFITWYYRNFINPEVGKTLAQVKRTHLLLLPVPTMNQDLSALADKMLTLNADLQQKVSRFLRRIGETYNLEKTTAALETFYTLSFSDFVKELGKQKVKLTLVQKDELEDYFNAYQAECQALKTAITTTDRAIDQMVYALYGLTAEEIAMVEK